MRTYFIRMPLWARSLYPDAIWSRDDTHDPERKLHITIDDGPHPESTHRWLHVLDQLSAKATFFVLGDQAMAHPQLIEDIKNKGHNIASHGMTHLDGWRTDTSKYVAQVQKSLDLLSCTAFRPPYGRITIKQYNLLKEKCDIIMWSLMVGDFDQKTTPIQIKRRIDLRSSEDIIVFHDQPDAIHRVATLLTSDNMTFVDE